MKRIRSLLTLVAALAASPLVQSADPDAALRTPLLGTWEGAVVSGDSERPGAPRNTLRELVITADRITAVDGDGRQLGSGSYTLALENGVLSIDATGLEGPARGQTMRGILKLEKGSLLWCTGNNGQPRPAEFRTRTPGAYLLVLTRRKN